MKVVLENLTKRFPSRNKKGEDVIAVNNFNFEIPDGQLIGLLGPSGCGKSTTLNLISGLEEPTSGKVWFGDEDVTGLPPEARGVGLVFQNYALYPHLTVEENIIFPLQNLKGDRKMTKEEMHRKALDIVFGITAENKTPVPVASATKLIDLLMEAYKKVGYDRKKNCHYNLRQFLLDRDIIQQTHQGFVYNRDFHLDDSDEK